MKALYIAFQTLEEASGITNKIIAQYRGLVNAGLDTDFCHYKIINCRWCFVVNDFEIGCIGSGFHAHLALYYNYEPVYKYIKDNKIDFVYIRYTQFATPFFCLFLRKVCKLGVIVFMEIPTWPYDTEYINGNYLNKIQRFLERKSRLLFRKYVNRIVTVQNYNRILSIPTIKITNGINLDIIKLRNPTHHSGFVIVGVAHLGDWHGYDRVIEGIGLYYRNKVNPEEITFYIIGSNEKVYDNYIALAKKYKIEKRIRFEGIKSGKELDSYFDMADFAISGLGGHRKGVFEAKALKSIEYAARGIPFICSDRDEDMAKWPFVLHAPQNDSYINIQEILDFNKSKKFDPSEIRKYVEKDLTWDAQMKIVVDELSVLK